MSFDRGLGEMFTIKPLVFKGVPYTTELNHFIISFSLNFVSFLTLHVGTETTHRSLKIVSFPNRISIFIQCLLNTFNTFFLHKTYLNYLFAHLLKK